MNTTYRERIESTLVETHREGIDSVVEWLGENHFYDAPASATHHNAFQGGLAKHSWEVYCQAMALWQASDHREAMAPESVAIAALLHDVCKADNYQFDSSNPYRIHPLNDNRAKGHGERSVRILERLGLAMSHEERMAIHWHMGEFELSSGGSEQDYEESVRIPLCNLVRAPTAMPHGVTHGTPARGAPISRSERSRATHAVRGARSTPPRSCWLSGAVTTQRRGAW